MVYTEYTHISPAPIRNLYSNVSIGTDYLLSIADTIPTTVSSYVSLVALRDYTSLVDTGSSCEASHGITMLFRV